MNQPNMNGLKVTERRGNTIFVRLPRELWRLCGPDGLCQCPTCQRTGRAAYWDTLAIAAGPTPGQGDYTYTVHHPSESAYEPIKVYTWDEQPYTTQTVSGPGYWSLHIPFVVGVPTEWHPTEPTGPFAVISRGAFDTEGKAIQWANDHLQGHPYTTVFRELPTE